MKTTWTGSLFVFSVLAVLSGPAAADSIGSTYDMDKLLSEPHPMANEYGSRWQQPPPQPAPTAPGTQPETLYLPVTPAPTAGVPSPSPVPGQAPEPPPTTFAPPEPPPVSSTAPPAPTPQPAPAKPSVAATAPPPPMMTPQLSIDLSGIDLKPEPPETPAPPEPEKPEAVLPPRMDKEIDQPGPRPPLPPQ